MKETGSKAPAAETKFSRRSDWLIITALMMTGLLGLLAFLSRAGSAALTRAQIFLDGALLAEVPLDEDRVFTLPECPEVTFEVKDGAIRFLSSDCPDKTCVRTGFLRSPGSYAVCLPNRIHIRLVSPSGQESGPDAITGFAAPEPRAWKGGAHV